MKKEPLTEPLTQEEIDRKLRRFMLSGFVAVAVFVYVADTIIDNLVQFTAVSLYNAFYSHSLAVWIISVATSIVPYIIGISIYYALVQKKIKELDAQAELQRQKVQKERNLMLSDLAHDVKTPITTIVGYSKALNDGLVPADRQADYLNTIYTKSMRVSDLVNMLFEYVQLDSAGFELHKKRTDIVETVLACCAEDYTDFEDKGLTLDIDIPETTCPMTIDVSQMTRVIHNLLLNAVKYCEEGSTVRVSLRIPETEGEELLISVADTGEPIDDALAETIFQPFSRGDKARSTKGGSGLGLSISAKIVEMHGGRLTLDRSPEAPFSKAFLVRLPKE